MPPQPKPKSNLLAFLKRFRKPPKPTTMELILMSKLAELVARVKILTAAHVDLKARIAALETEKAALMSKVAELTAQGIADDATIAELMAMIDGALNEAPGGSTGNM